MEDVRITAFDGDEAVDLTDRVLDFVPTNDGVWILFDDGDLSLMGRDILASHAVLDVSDGDNTKRVAVRKMTASKAFGVKATVMVDAVEWANVDFRKVRLCGTCHRDVGELPACATYDRQADGHCVCGHDEACHATEAS